MESNGNFKPGTKLCLRSWTDRNTWRDRIYEVERLLASGGQADTYVVHPLEGGESLCMKHLYGNFASNKATYYQKVLLMAKYPSPSPHLAWPLAVSPNPSSSGSFCYCMPLFQGYDDTSRIISFLKRYNSTLNHPGAEPNDPYYVPPRNPRDPNDPAAMTVRQRAELLCRTAEIMEAVHVTGSGRPGYVYGDLSGKNVLYKVQPDGHVDVKLIDVDNLIPAGQSARHPKGFTLGLVGTGQYPAPEILSGASVPTIHGDLHSLGVLAFRVLHGSHPLDGLRTHTMEWNNDNVVRFFGEQATFTITDPHNAASAPVLSHWDQLPQVVQVYFKLLFSPQVLHSPVPAPGGREPRPSAETLRLCLVKGYRLTA